MLIPRLLFILLLLAAHIVAQSWQTLSAGSRIGHGAMVSSAVFSPDSKYLASYDQPGTIVIWDLASGKVVTQIDDTDSESFKEPVFSPDGKILAAVVERHDEPTVLFEETIRFWEVPSGKPIGSPEGSFRGIEYLTFSPDSKTLLASVEMKRTETWNVFTLKRNSPTLPYIGPYAFDGKGTRLAATSPDNRSVIVLDAATRRRMRVMPGYGFVVSIAFDPEGRYLAVNDETKASGIRLKMFDLTAGRAIAGFDVIDQHPTAAFTADGRSVIAIQFEKNFAEEAPATSRIGALFSPATGRKVKDLVVSSPVNGFGTTFSRDGRFLAVRSSSSVTNTVPDTELRVIDLVAGTIAASLRGYRRQVTSLAFSDDGSKLFSGHPGEQVIEWSTADWRPVRSLSIDSESELGPVFIGGAKYFTLGNELNAYAVATGKKSDDELKSYQAVSGNGEVMFAADDEQFAFYSVPSQELLFSYATPFGWIDRSFALDRTGTKFAAGQDGYLDVVTSRSGSLINRFTLPKGTISQVAFSPDGKYIGLMNSESASATSRFTLNVLDAITGKVLLKVPKESEYFAFTPDGANVASLNPLDRLLITRIADGQTIIESKIRVRKLIYGVCYAFHPSQPLIAVGTEYGTHVFNMSSGEQVARLR